MKRQLLVLLAILANTLAATAQNESQYEWYRQVTSNEELVDGDDYILVGALETDGLLYTMQPNTSQAFAQSTPVYNNNLVNGWIPLEKVSGRVPNGKFDVAHITLRADNDNHWQLLWSGTQEYYTASNAVSSYFYSHTTANTDNDESFVITFDAQGNANISSVLHNTHYVRMYYNTDRYFVLSATAYTDHIRPVQLYRKVTDHYLRDIALEIDSEKIASRYATVCLPYAVSEVSHSGARFFEVGALMKDAAGSLTAIGMTEVTTLAARKPYIFCATEKLLRLPMGTHIDEGEPVATGLVGNLGTGKNKVPEGAYIIKENQLHRVAGQKVTVAPYRAYLDLSGSIPLATDLPAKQRERLVPLHNENAESTALTSPQAVGARGDKWYNAYGQRVSPDARGLLIRGGKKTIRH